MWFIFALNAALFDAARDVMGKKGLEKTNFAPYTISWGLTVFSYFFLFPFVVLNGLPEINHTVFWTALLCGGLLNVFAFANYFKALKIADLSLIAPLTSLTPVFLLFISPLLSLISGQDFDRELPTSLGIIGVVFVGLGSYILNLNFKDKGALEPLKVLLTNEGARRALFAAFLWSVTLSITKVGVNSITGESDLQKALFWGCLLMFTISMFTLPFVFRENLEREKLESETETNGIKEWWKWKTLIEIGLLNAVVIFSQIVALSLVVVAYAIAVKRLGSIFKVVLGAVLFDEPYLKERIAASSIMVFGVVCISLTNVLQLSQLIQIIQGLLRQDLIFLQ
ncbi:MAG: EamA family transporter [Xenococcaceae cyanobacterium]